MRKRGRTDSNQKAVVDALREVGCSVVVLSSHGKGVGDILVGRRKVNYLFEIKDGAKSKSRQALTDDEQTFHANWAGQIDTVRNAQEALAIVDAYGK